MTRRYIVERDIIGSNAEAIRTAAGDAAVYAVLKADGYGLGLEPLARTLAGRGLRRFCVTEAEDALRLAETELPMEEILMLRPLTEERDLERLLLCGTVTFCVASAEDAARLARAGVRLGIRPRAHVKIDTGLGRYGIPWDRPMAILYIYESFPALSFTGIYTHFASPGRSRSVRRQLGRFRQVLRRLEAAGIDPGLRHCAASTALLRYPETRMDAVRIGTAFLGRAAGGEAIGLRPVGWCEARVDAVKTLSPGQTVGYGSAYRVPRETRTAVVNVGAVHGLRGGSPRGRTDLLTRLKALVRAALALAGDGGGLYGELDGRRVPVLGNVCAECVVLDVTGCRCRPGDTVRFSLNPLYISGMERVWTGAEGPVMTEFQPERHVRPVA